MTEKQNAEGGCREFFILTYECKNPDILEYFGS